MGRHRFRLHSRRRKILLGVAFTLVPPGVWLVWMALWVPGWWIPAVCCWAVVLLLMRLARGWPVLARWIFLWEIDRVARHGTVTRTLLWERFIRIGPEPHKDELGDAPRPELPQVNAHSW